MKKRILSILLLCCMVLTLLPTAAFAAGEIDEQFTLAPGGTYYFDLSAMGIPGTVNDALPDKTMRYVPFTYAGTVDSYKLTSEMATTEEYAQQSKYAHSLFIADFAVTHEVSWDNLNAKGLIFGKNYTAGGVSYTLRAPSVGSDSAGSGDSQHGTPQSNEWDRILDKNDGYIKNWSRMYSWGQDISRSSWTTRAFRGYISARYWTASWSESSRPSVGFRPVLEILNPGTLGSDGLKAVTLDLGGGKLGNSFKDIQIIVKKGSEFTAPASDGLTRPEGNTDSYFQWLGSDGKLYAPGDSVPADVIKLTAQFDFKEQFTLAPGGVYYFDLSGVSIPGTANGSLPDKTMHYVPFTYAGTVVAYKLTSEMATTEEYAQQNEYAHSLFVADYAVTHAVSWDNLNAEGLIFGKGYATGSVDYTLRAPSGGSGGTGSGALERGTPQSNEWDRILDKDDGYIKNWRNIGSWGQDTLPNTLSNRVIRGQDDLPRTYAGANTTLSFPFLGFRPVLEVLNPGTLGSDGLKAVTLDLGGGKLGGSSDTIQIIVKTGESFTAPASEGLTRPDGNTGSYFEWLGSDGELYAPDDNVPADVTKLTAQFVPPEQFTLAPGGTYYFDLSGENIPGTASGNLQDKSMHHVPFTYAGTVDAYKLTSEMETTEEYAEQKKYPHSLFVADYAVTYAASWDHLNAIDMIFGKDYTAGGVDYTMRAPSEGSDYTGSGDSERGTPQSNEWDRLLDKDDGYIKNWNGLFSCGQDSVSGLSWRRTVRGYYSSRFCGHRHAAGQNSQVGFRPVLEVLNHDTIGPDGLKAVALDLGGGKLGDESSIRIIVKNGSAFTAPSGDGLTRPEGATGNYFKWLGSDGKLYAPGESVSADVTTLTARFVPDTYTVIVTTDTLPDGKTGKAYSHTLTAISTAPITWRIDEGALPAGLRLNEKTGEISGIPTAAGTATFTVKAENSEGSDTRALSIIISNPVEQTPVRYLDADGKERFCTEYTVLESVIIEDFFDSDNKWYDMPAGWYVVEGDVTITPRLDTHGAVNLILTDDCHLTVPWGINVKEGDTFTICAQSTAEASMGKLTACLPEWSDHDKSVWPVAGLSGIGAGVRVWAANDNYHENEGTIIINGGNIHAKGQQGSSAIGGSDYDRNVSSDGDTPGNLRQGGSITINGGIVCTELRTSGGAHTADSFGIGTCGGNGGSVTINGGTIIAEASSSAISSGRGGSITINGGNVTAHGGINRYENQPLYAIPGNGIGPLEGGSITINGGMVKASSEGDGFGIGGAGVHHTAEMHITINGGNIETTANRNNAAIGDKSKQKSSVTITDGVIHAVGKGSAAGIGSTGDIRITGGEISVFAEGGGAAIGSIGGVDCKSITINGNAIKSLSSKDGACIGAATGGSVGSITISDAELPLLSSNKILIGWDADSPGGKLTIRNCRVASTDTLSALTDGIRVGSNSELVIEESEIRLPHLRGIRVGGNGSIAVRDSDLHTYGIFMDETAQSSNDAKTLKKLEITNSTVLTGDIIGARGGYSSVDEVVIHGSSIRLNDEYTYNYCTIGGGTHGSFGSIDIQNSQIHIPSSGGNTAIGNGWQVYYNRESRIRIANSEVSVRCASLGPAIGAAWDSGSGRINIIIENSTVTAKGGNLRTDGNYVPGIGKNALGRAPEIGIQILNSTVDTFRLTEKGGTDYVYDDLHEKNLPGIPPENITICGSTVNGTRIDHSPDEYGKCALCGKYDIGYCYEHGLLTMEGLTDCVSDGSEKKMTGLSHKTGENETKQLTENTDYTAIYSNNVHPYTLKPDDAGFDPAKAPKVTLYGTGNYCGKAEHYFTISENAAAAPSITTSSLPDGKVGEAYSQTLTANGTTPIKWSISGALPDGLSLNKDTGKISGTPTADGTAKFTVKATNSVGSDTKKLSITITKDAPAEFTISVKTDGNGTASASLAKAAANTEITLSATPNEGYHFKEWEVESPTGLVITNNKFTMPEGNVEVKAIFEEDVPAPTEFTITVKTDSNGTASASPAKAVAGTEITLTATPNTGYHFKEWQVESPAGLVITNNKFTMPDSDVEVKAIFEEDAPPAPTDPAKPSISVTGTYTYNGSEHTATVSGYDPATMDISGNTGTDAGDYTVRVMSKTGKWADGSTDAVTAAWSIGKATQEAPNGLIGVAPTTEGGSDGKITGVDATMEYRAESEITYTACTGIEIENLSAGNYFVRYAEDHNHFASPDAEVTVGEGKPLADFTITFNGNGGSGSMEPVTVKAGTNYILPACGFTAPADQEFKAWEIGGAEYKVGDSYTVDRDTEIKALWENSVITPTTYTVTVGNDGNGTGTATPSTAVAGTTITLTAMPNEGYHFKEWEVISGGVTIKDDKFLMPNDNVEVRAIFEEDAPAPTEFTITVKTDGNGTASASHVKAVAGTEITLTATPKTGYHFKEWQVMSGGVTIKDDKFLMPNDNVEVKAIFEKDAPPAPTEFTITVKTDGNGTVFASHVKAVADTEITLTAMPNEGYHFKEWQVMSGGVTIKDNKFLMPSANVEVKAIFEKNAPPAPTEFIVTFDGNGGTPSVGSMTTTNRKLTSLPSASRSGSYSFDGWYTEKSGGTKITTATVFSAKTTVYAHWTYTGGGGGGYNPPVTYYTLRFETGGGSDIPSVREAYNTYIDLTKYVPTWRGHTFIGWYTERSLMNKVSGVYLTKDMTVYALWRVDENPGTGANPFTDVSEKDWFYGDVMFVYENGLMLGTSKTLFSPHGTATRGMMATILWRMEGSPVPKGKNSFTDVEAGKWYADAITWTAENGIFAGYGKDKFGPDDPITREQLAAIFYRYADYKGYDLTVKGNLDKFKDADKITDYAKTAMQWAVGSGLVNGKSGNLLDPQGTATRAEIAAMLHRFIEKYELVQGKAPGGLMGWIDPKRLQIPKTGDSSVLGLWGFSLCTSLAGCLALTTWQIRRRREEEALQIIEK
ncbi:InlB B-repeat-containing protein [Dysosmobacter welbionis]|uniref:InlB B-repeat-containing protein n=1 Tax=Dysosmobacter welbionis TaxID=2093857 RepID=UPI0021097360|nr:InlB B-repeat-containing protein [Dysosmobacter welbionis]MCQ5042398.1 InlB B-repeat-containing protein [Dysosmobacter welbionis]